MDCIDFGYSMKNIPLPTQENYIYKLIDKTEKLLKRMRWKAFFFEKDHEKEMINTDRAIFKSRKCPPQVPDLISFENDIQKMIEKIEFRTTSNEFLALLKQDIDKIRKSEKLLVAADKTQNFYEMNKDSYRKILHENVTKNYKKANTSLPNSINLQAKKIGTKLKLHEKVDIMAQQQCFITIKDHKPDYRTNPKYRLLNPTKSELGKVSQQILQKINETVRTKVNTNQWQNTSSVIKWFENIKEKTKHTFTVFDIEEFYPSITETLLKKAINFAKHHTTIDPTDMEVIFHSRKSLLFNNHEAWVKKNDNENFDVTMGSYDGAEVCELVGLFMLNKLSDLIEKKNVGLYRDDGLAIFKNHNGHENDKTRKQLIEIFKEHELKIVIQCNLKSVDYLDITLDLNTGSYKPYNKLNNDPRYINANSNHPPSIIKQIPKSISKRISNNSQNENIFQKASPFYNNSLNKCGYTEKLTYCTDENQANGRKNRKRNIIWYNPPYSKNVKSNIGKQFLKLVNKHFDKNHKYHKIFNKNNVKISYSCMDSMKKILNAHNKKISSTNNDETARTCNCKNKNTCPLEGKCLSANIVYSAEVKSFDNQPSKTYIGISETEFKIRFGNHKKSFKHRRYEKDTELSKYVWELKDRKVGFEIKWSILRHAQSYNPSTKTCNLCLTEKLLICNFKNKTNLINKRLDLVSKCRHENKYILCNYK